MIFNIKWSIVIFMLCSNFAWAYVPYRNNSSGRHGISADLETASGESKLKTSTNGDKLSGILTGAGYSYGLSEDFTLGANIFYTNITSTTDNTDSKFEVSGLRDLDLFFHGSTEMGGNFLYGTDFYISLGDATKDYSDAKTTKWNAFSGGHTLMPYFGYEMTFGRPKIGVIAATGINLNDKNTKIDPGNVSISSTGGEKNTLSAFLELSFDFGTFGFEFKNTGTNSAKGKGSGYTLTINESSESDFIFYGLFKAGIVDIHPFVDYSKANTDAYEKNYSLVLGCDVKFLF